MSLWHQLTVLTNATKNSILDVVGVVDLPPMLLGEIFQIFLSVRHIAQLRTHGKTENCEVCCVLCKIIARKDIISNKQFPTINRQVLLFVDRFCRFFLHQLHIGVLKNICSKIWCKGIVIEITVQYIFHVNESFPWKKPIISMNYFKRVFQEFWP